jgi:cytidylate kinase
MKKLITISRQYGSGGRIIGKMLADKLGVPFYDKEIIDMAVEASGYSREVVEGAEMKAKSGFAYSLASALSFNEGSVGTLSVNDRLFLAQFQVIKEIGDTGQGVIIGRCADDILKELPENIRIFIHAPIEYRTRRIANEYGISLDKAKDKVLKTDKARATFYKSNTSSKWGDVQNYHLCIDGSAMSTDKAARVIADFVKSFIEVKENGR